MILPSKGSTCPRASVVSVTGLPESAPTMTVEQERRVGDAAMHAQIGIVSTTAMHARRPGLVICSALTVPAPCPVQVRSLPNFEAAITAILVSAISRCGPDRERLPEQRLASINDAAEFIAEGCCGVGAWLGTGAAAQPYTADWWASAGITPFPDTRHFDTIERCAAVCESTCRDWTLIGPSKNL
jgi:hypothetical protein